MRKSFMTFWKDYAEVTKSSWIWLKKHWFGYIVLVLVVVGGEFVWFFRNQIKDSFRRGLTKSVKVKGDELEYGSFSFS